MARRLIVFLVATALLMPAAPAHAQAPPGAVGGFACGFLAPNWPGNGRASCGWGPLPGDGQAWGTWTSGPAVYVCDPTCTAQAEFAYGFGLCPTPDSPPVLTTGTGWLLLDGVYRIDFNWTLAGTVLVMTPHGAGGRAAGIGSFLHAPPLTTCSAAGMQAAHIVAVFAN